ncbi:DNA repair protein XRCC3 homolog [Caerostris darwini]|uniref:DNA repair protein XRCC3 homolog n=1 Tax=Caerostris darwini TaxID=1538125 RepID=A0AAV4QQS0_9ARAC|nr:DNA repair protein XRCC3 homolog [Caerostris darwini]
MTSPLLKKQKLCSEIDDISIHPHIIYKLKEAKLYTFQAILHLSYSELQKIAKITSSEAQIVLESISEALLKHKVITAFDMLHNEDSTVKGKLICDLLKNGSGNCDCIYTSSITEICGESGCGKTQLCLYLSICAQMPTSIGGLNSKVVYIHSEGDFPIKRFLQMANAFKNKHPKLQNIKLSDNLILKKVFNLGQLMYVLQKGLPELLKKVNNLKIIIIDSVAALLRSEYDSLNERTSLLLQLATEIWKLANINGMAVICVNQVSGSNKGNGKTNLDVPSLGLLWSNILTTRIKISRNSSENNVPSTRNLGLIFSSYHSHLCNNFIISENGINIIGGS